MVCGLEYCVLLLSLTILLLTTITQSERAVKTAVFLSPKFMLQPGSVFQNTFYNIDFPRDHIAIKSFDAEVVDKGGNPISLHETYLHHWHVIRYHTRKGSKSNDTSDKGLCKNHHLVQYFGLGSESRNTKTYLPDPYGVEVGNQVEIPNGYEERWMLDVHVIDTRGVDDILGCIECRCNLYNVTNDSGYKGGLNCCYHNTKCRLQEGFLDSVSISTLFVKYTLKYIDWDSSILPVGIYILDVSTTFKSSNQSGGPATHNCQGIISFLQTEYDVKPCSVSGNKEDCIDSKTASLSLPAGGDVIFAVAHQHRGGIGSILHGQDGRVLCSSFPVYEDGYIVGMSTCFPKPGSTKISAGESLTIVSNYSSVQMHTGVTGIFYLIVADSLSKSGVATNASLNVPKKPKPSYVWFIMFPGVVAIMAIIIGYGKRCKKEGYIALRI